jgi:7-cyano-7-deazaguanine synthase
MGGGRVIRRALLLSGGMDSTALAWGLRPELAISVNYGQVAAAGELRAASAVASYLGMQHRHLEVDCNQLGSGDMAGRDPHLLAPVTEWWPFRNQLLITFAACIAIQQGITHISFGTVASDESHADGRAEFFYRMRQALLVQEGQIELEVPAIKETTVELCKRVQVPFDLLAWSHSCHVADYACGRCRGCNKHRQTMIALGYDNY